MIINGVFDPANLPPTEITSMYPKILKRINRTDKWKDNPLKLNDIYDRQELFKIRNKWNRVPLGLTEQQLEEFFITGEDPRLNEPAEELIFEPKRKEEGVIHQGPDDEPVWKRAIKILPGDQSKIQTPPLFTPQVDQQLVASAPQINQQTGLTHSENALLSNEEKAIKLRSKGMA